METTHRPDAWHDLYVMLGTSSAALIGLLFVSTSLHLDQIMNNQIYRIRSRNVTLHLIVTLIQAAAILTPQPMAVLGVELVVVNLFGLWFPLSFTFRAFLMNRALGQSGNFSIYRSVTYIGSYLLGIAGGAALVKLANWGMYLVTFAYVTFLVAAIWNAWMLMLGIGQTEKAKEEKLGATRKAGA
jgi:hypothetical protein